MAVHTSVDTTFCDGVWAKRVASDLASPALKCDGNLWPTGEAVVPQAPVQAQEADPPAGSHFQCCPAHLILDGNNITESSSALIIM